MTNSYRIVSFLPSAVGEAYSMAWLDEMILDCGVKMPYSK
jgi:hypothetical protein